ncbi:MAG TPA: hypothetical protein VHE30_17755 [Polyangiaceae bacterium]|nr:hypothetical protein [Polyangiaceae bacterium]
MPIKLTNHPKLRTIRFVANGVLTAEDLDKANVEGKAMSDSYEGRKHMVLADMRGLKTVDAKNAARLGELISYQRSHGVFLCVHISDETITRLQMGRLSRQAQANDAVTVDVVSLEEGEKVLSEARMKLRTEE